MLKSLQVPFLWRFSLGFIIALQFSGVSVRAQVSDSLDTPFFETRRHSVGSQFWSVSNTGSIRGAGAFMGIWVGGIRQGDTLVAFGADGWTFFPEFQPATKRAQIESGEQTVERSIVGDLKLDNPLAKSDQDIIMFFYDTTTSGFPRDQATGLLHNPLGIRVRQSSYTWSPNYADQFILIDYEITNLEFRELRRVYLGLFFDGSDFPSSFFGIPTRGVQGFKRTATAFTNRPIACEYQSQVRVAWFASPDGLPNPITHEFNFPWSVKGIVGYKIFGHDSDGSLLSWNWWITDTLARTDFGPRKRGTRQRPFADYGGRLGTPLGNSQRYDLMSSETIDYDQLNTMLDHTADGWLPPPANPLSAATGRYDGHSLLSVGPFDIPPGGVVSFTAAVGFGLDFHTDSRNFEGNYDPLNPEAFLETLDFSDLLNTMGMAEWVYDNPGFDTNGDGFKGNFRICMTDEALAIETTYVIDSMLMTPIAVSRIDTFLVPAHPDTVFLEGDGVPDFRGIAPPARPVIRYTPERGRIILEWNGIASETEKDMFTNEIDFEGYRVYLGLSLKNSDLILMASYDIKDYVVWYFNPERLRIGASGLQERGDWELVGVKKKLEIQALYADGSLIYDPLFNGIDNPTVSNDSAIYFAILDWNQDDLTDTTSIHKIYPNAPYPHTLAISEAFTEDTQYEDPQTGKMTFYEGGELTPDGKRFKFFEYRMILDNLLPSQVYYVSVTAFDFGNPSVGLKALESNKVLTAVKALAQDRKAQNAVLDVIVYPNPYRIDGRYREFGFEGRGREDFPDERLREVHWTNLPPVCDISVYSLDGDLVRTIEHRKTLDDPSAMHDSWDVISRNLLPVVSGIYYWTVETPEGRTQIGKLVLIM